MARQRGVELGRAPIVGDLFGEHRILTENPQRRAVGGHAVLTGIFRRHGDDDRLALGAAESARILHEDVVVSHKGAEVFRTARVRAEDVRNETELRSIRLVNVANVGREIRFGGLAEAGSRRRAISPL